MISYSATRDLPDASANSVNPVGVASANGSCAVPCQWLPQAGIVTLAACHRDGHPGRRVASDGPGLAGLRASVGSESTIDISKPGYYYFTLFLFRYIIRIMTLLFSIMTLLYHLFFLQMSRLLFFIISLSPEGLLFHL